MLLGTWSSDLDDQKSGAAIQMEGHTLTPTNGPIGPKEMEASGSTPLHSPSQSPVRKQMPDCPEAWYCLEIQVTSTKDGGTTLPPPYAWQVPMVEDMLWDGKSGLMEAVVTGSGQAILFYVRQSLGEGLSLRKVWDAMFMLLGAISWVGKQAQLNTNAVSWWEGWQLISQAITEWCIEARGPRHPCSYLPALPPFISVTRTGLHGKRDAKVLMNGGRCWGILIRCHTMNEVVHHKEAGTTTSSEKNPVTQGSW